MAEAKLQSNKKEKGTKTGDGLWLAAGILLFSLSISHVFHSRLLFLLLIAARRINFREVQVREESGRRLLAISKAQLIGVYRAFGNSIGKGLAIFECLNSLHSS